MSHFESNRFFGAKPQRFRRPSTWTMLGMGLGAGLLAADRLRWLPTAWTGAILIAGCVLTLLGAALLFARRARTPRHREVQVLVLPLSRAIEPDTRWRIVAFALFVAALVVVPAFFA